MRDLIGEVADTSLVTGAGDVPPSPTVRVRVEEHDVDDIWVVRFVTGPRTGDLTYRHADELHVLSVIDLLGELVGE